MPLIGRDVSNRAVAVLTVVPVDERRDPISSLVDVFERTFRKPRAILKCACRTLTILDTILPQDKLKNANGRRRRISADVNESLTSKKPKEELPPLMRKILREFAATGLPAAFIPHTPSKQEK